MEFLVKLTPHLPDTLNEEEFNDLLNCERARGARLMEEKKMARLWRLPGTSSALMLWDVTGPDELHECLSSLPMWRYCDAEITVLTQHPVETAHRKDKVVDGALDGG